jgi:glutathione synthase/RimK-type ligase-like ATP-grasp enzyme
LRLAAKITKVHKEFENKRKMITPQVLLLGSRFDFTCDYIVAALRQLGTPYLRLNSEDLSSMPMELDPNAARLSVIFENVEFRIHSEALSSILFRRPVYLRDYGGDEVRTSEDRFSAIQWSAFLRNLMIFDDVRWYNSPVATYQAEHKAFQLSVAAKLGFAVPETAISNAPRLSSRFTSSENVALKGLDTVMVRDSKYETFGFTTFSKYGEISLMDWSTAPGIIQAAIEPKLDLRVTVIDDKVFSTSITINGKGVEGDWRAQKNEVSYRNFVLPDEVQNKCVALTRRLGLRFGAIDLALKQGICYFLEINPTGEWAWLVDAAGHPIDKAFANALALRS